MNSQDERLREYFEDERRSDARTTPSFHELATRPSARPDAAERPRSGLRLLLGAGLVAAAAAGVLLVTQLTARPDADPNAATFADLEEVCDAALAALEEQEAEARLLASTDELLDPLPGETD